MDQMPPTREQLERMPLPELLRAASQLGADVSFVHDRRDVIDALAAQRQQLLSRYADELLKFKIRLEGHGQELTLGAQEYQATYDRVEQAVTDRFAALHDQLLRKEVEVRGQLAILKNSGDEVLQDCKAAMDRELALLNDTLAKCQSRDVDVLEITPATAPVTVAVPHLTGRCFVFQDCGALDLSQLRVALDLQATSRAVQMTPPVLGDSAPPVVPIGRGSQHPSPRHASYDPVGRGAQYAPEATPPPAWGARRVGVGAARLTFPTDSEIETADEPGGGLMLRMVPHAVSEVVGTRALETFTEGLHSWKVRLDRFEESLLGVVDSRDTNSHLGAGDGFFWSPVRGDVHGQRGRPTPELRRHPPAQAGDVLKLVFDADAGSLRVLHNGIDRGIVCTDLRGVMSPCFIFARGECITLLQ
eukprot:TRINITY_DN19403_c0_g1_i1.p1 TRINITY_DN19403_c0_g1~~TRINITY_DN19403_c0_g1_i1.p1  ORF type:complete len:417 (+),score=130.97 TRINITY_DN19403_c0_g1_i1:92-1342(+)